MIEDDSTLTAGVNGGQLGAVHSFLSSHSH